VIDWVSIYIALILDLFAYPFSHSSKSGNVLYWFTKITPTDKLMH